MNSASVVYEYHYLCQCCETLLKAPTIKKITLVTTPESKAQQDDTQDKLGELQQSLHPARATPSR